MTYKTPSLDVVGAASSLTQGPIGSPTDSGGSGLMVRDIVSTLEE
jgi:hypothetical protein